MEFFGDYFVGLNYVLFISGIVKFFFFFGVEDFIKCFVFIFYIKEVFVKEKDVIVLFVKKEGLDVYVKVI